MAEGRKYYVICADKCLFEGLTKEQTLTAIEQAVATGEIKDVNTGFVTTIKEQNAQTGLKFWVGTQDEYNAITERSTDTLYLISDNEELDDIEAAINNCADAISDIETQVTALKKTDLVAINTSPVVSSDVVNIYARRVGNAVIMSGKVIIQPTAVTMQIASTANAPKTTIYAPVTAVSVGGAYKAGYCTINTAGKISFSGVTANDTVYLNLSYGIPQ